MGDNDRDIVTPQAVCDYVTKNWAWSRYYRGCNSNDTAPGLETEPRDEWPHAMRADALLRLSVLEGIPVRYLVGVEFDADRPSPGDDITRAAFDAMDGAS